MVYGWYLDTVFTLIYVCRVSKTDLSKTSCFTFGGNKKLELDRPLPKKWSFRDKAISSFVHNDKH